MRLVLMVLALWIAAGPEAAQSEPLATREMNLLDWQEFARLVPEQIDTVLLPTGTLEPHGVAPNGSDNLAPEAMARAVAPGVNAVIAPTLNYGITRGYNGFPGAFTITEEAYSAFVRDILVGLIQQDFKNIIILNGHGGDQPRVLNELAGVLGPRHKVRMMVINWWNVVGDDTQEIMGNAGGHAGDNETAYMQAIVPRHIHPERYDPDMARAFNRTGGWAAYPFPSSIGLYKEGEGRPAFDEAKARQYFERVNTRIESLIRDTIRRWDKAGIYR